MLSSEHKAEAERLIEVARTSEGKKAVGKYGDPSDPVATTVLAGVHAALAAVPDDVVDAEVVDEEAEQLVARARALAAQFANTERDPFVGLLEQLANALEDRAGSGSGVQINADSFDADPDVFEVPASALRDLTDRVVGAVPGNYAGTLDEVLATLRGWQR